MSDQCVGSASRLLLCRQPRPLVHLDARDQAIAAVVRTEDRSFAFLDVGPTLAKSVGDVRLVGARRFISAIRPQIMSRIDSRPPLKDIRVPTLVVSGGADRLISNECSREMAELIPRANLEILAQCCHCADGTAGSVARGDGRVAGIKGGLASGRVATRLLA